MAVHMPPAVNAMQLDEGQAKLGSHDGESTDGNQQKVLWESGSGDTKKPGPKLAAPLKLRLYQEALINKEVEVGSLWKDRIALVMLLPDIKSVRSRDMLLSAALIQVHLRKLGVALCLIFPVSNPKFAKGCADDFSLSLDNVEVYADTTRTREVLKAFGMVKKPVRRHLSTSECLEATGYWTMRACCGPAHNPVCCVNGFGCRDNTDLLGGVFLLAPGEKIQYKAIDENGRMKIDTDAIMAQCTRRAVIKSQKDIANCFVSV
mmetsp:Transcript_14563/g.29114  ORF Transcript_14563/g.29114 Transcript_14563/m.29114 type:complete len:262 (+) Transcript_14563:137-922(+)